MEIRKIKVVFVSHSSEVGGAEKSLIELISGLSKEGIFCHVIIPGEGSLAMKLKQLSINFSVTHLPWCANDNGLFDSKNVKDIGKSTLEVIKILKEINPDIVYTNSSVILQGALAAKSLGLKHIWHIREFGELDYGIDFYLPLARRSKFVYDYSDKIIFISNALKNYYHAYIPEDKSVLIYNNVKVPELKDSLNFQKDSDLTLLMVGHVHPGKGQMEAVKAIKVLKERGITDVKLNIVGKRLDKYYNEILAYISENELNSQINFFDYTNNPSEFFLNSDVVLMCSRSEGFGRVTVEGMLFEKPVIGAAAGGTLDIIKDEYNGLLYQPGNEFDLAAKIMIFFDNREKISEFGKNGKLFCEDHFSDKKYIGEIKSLIEKILEKKDDSYEDLLKSLFPSDSIVEEFKKKLEETNEKLESNNRSLKNASQDIEKLKNDLNAVYFSREWKLALILQKIVKILFPIKSWRRIIAANIWRLIKKIIKVVIAFYKTSIFVFLLKKDLLLYKKIKRNINAKSKKILFIGHSYHEKTKSSDFMVEYLKNFFDVEVLYDSSWETGKLAPDLSFVDEKYIAVVFWQLLPSNDILRSLKNDNLIFFPMYDQSGGMDYGYWKNYRNLKIINFSKSLHAKLKKWHFDSLYIQYFPQPLRFNPGKKDEIFFWQRLSKINIDTVVELLVENKFKLHIHKAIDPGHDFKQPTLQQEKKYSISYSEWFEAKKDMHNMMKQKGIYIAPREYEGIGMSFLEAMAMGKAVIAVDNPTMNEYIEHGVNGFLFNPNKPQKIDFVNIEQVQKNAYEYMKKGYFRWENDKYKIIDFIKKA